jgi:hypothetical protein
VARIKPSRAHAILLARGSATLLPGGAQRRAQFLDSLGETRVNLGLTLALVAGLFGVASGMLERGPGSRRPN